MKQFTDIDEAIKWIFGDGWKQIPREKRDRKMQRRRGNYQQGKMTKDIMLEVIENVGTIKTQINVELN